MKIPKKFPVKNPEIPGIEIKILNPRKNSENLGDRDFNLKIPKKSGYFLSLGIREFSSFWDFYPRDFRKIPGIFIPGIWKFLSSGYPGYIFMPRIRIFLGMLIKKTKNNFQSKQTLAQRCEILLTFHNLF